MLQLTSDHLEQYVDLLEEADKAFVGNIQRDAIATAQADIFFQLGIRDKELMKYGINLAGATKGIYHANMMDIVSKFQSGKYTFDVAFSRWKETAKRAMEGMYRAGASQVGNPFYKDLPIPRRDLQLMARYLRSEGKFFKQFLWDIKDPKHVPLSKIPKDAAGKYLSGYRLQRFGYPQRAGLYPESMKTMQFNGMVMGAGSMMEIRWVLGAPMLKHCNDCPRLARRVWTPKTLPTTPKAGFTECKWACLCHLEFRQKMTKKTFDIAGSATSGALQAAGRYSRVYDAAGMEVGGVLQADMEMWSAQMNKARQMMAITKGKDRMFWIRERKRFNHMIIDRAKAGGYRSVPTISVSSLVKTIRAAQAKGGMLVDDFMTLVVGDEVWLVRSDYSSFGTIGMQNGVLVFKSPTGVVLNPNFEADIIFMAKKKITVDYGNYFVEQKDIDRFLGLIGKSKSPYSIQIISEEKFESFLTIGQFDVDQKIIYLNGRYWTGNLLKIKQTMRRMIRQGAFSSDIIDELYYALQHEIGHGMSNLSLQAGEWLPKTTKQLKAIDDYWYSMKFEVRDEILIKALGRNAAFNRAELLADIYAMWKSKLSLTKEMKRLIVDMGWATKAEIGI